MSFRQRFAERHICPRVGHRYVPWWETGKIVAILASSKETYVCTRCASLLRTRALAHSDSHGVMGRDGSGGWVLQGPQPLWVGWRMQIAQCGCGLQFGNLGAYMWHWHRANREEKGNGR